MSTFQLREETEFAGLWCGALVYHHSVLIFVSQSQTSVLLLQQLNNSIVLLRLCVIQWSPVTPILDVHASTATDQIFTDFDIAPVRRYVEQGTLPGKSFRLPHSEIDIYSGTDHDFQQVLASFQGTGMYGCPSIYVRLEHSFGGNYIRFDQLFHFVPQLLVLFFHHGEDVNGLLFNTIRLLLLHAHV